jgi:hypothetical protein
MNPSEALAYSADNILADVLPMVDDEEFRDKSRGYYLSQIQRALEELSYDTFFFKRSVSIVIPDSLQMSLPSDMFSLDQAYLYNGDYCDLNNAQNVYFKRNFYRSEDGYVARDKWSNRNDPFHKQRGARTNTPGQYPSQERPPSHLHFMSIQNGMLMLSDSCAQFDKIYLVYYGVGTEIGEEPIIPGFLRQAVIDYVTYQALLNKIAQDDQVGRWQALLRETKQSLYGTGLRRSDGSWFRAERRVKHMDKKAWEDMREYMARPYIG